eukprot:4740772-Amphidinium_carterae.1
MLWRTSQMWEVFKRLCLRIAFLHAPLARAMHRGQTSGGEQARHTLVRHPRKPGSRSLMQQCQDLARVDTKTTTMGRIMNAHQN